MRSHRFVLLAGALVLFVVALSARQSTDDDLELRAGIQAYKGARYDEAKEHFARAIARDPQNTKAHIYLATTYAQEYIPGADTPGNNALALRAIEQYKIVLELDAANINATKGIAYLFLQMKKFGDAGEYYRKAIEINPKDPENYYSMGVIEWTQTYQPRMELRAKLDLKPEQPLIRLPECWSVRDANKEHVESGIEMLKKAIDLRSDYDDAMAYMNLMYRERADIQCGDAKVNAEDLKTADKWVDVTLAVKRLAAEKQNGKQPGSLPSTEKDSPQSDSPDH
jgi:tetratricopeptide (TPR) repeat protein